MINCLTYIAFVYWAVSTVHTVLPIDVAVCGADPSRGGLGAVLHHTFGGRVDRIDKTAWDGFPCQSNLLYKLLFLLQRPGATLRHIMDGGGQDEPYVPILFMVPLAFMTIVLVRQLTGVWLISDTLARTMLKFGIGVGCRFTILLQSLLYPARQSLYYKRYSKVEFFIVAWTAYIIEIPLWHEAAVSGGTMIIILLMCCLAPGDFLPEVNPWNVALQSIAATTFAVAHAYYQQHRRIREHAARAARTARKVAEMAAAATAEEDEAAAAAAGSSGGTATAITTTAAAATTAVTTTVTTTDATAASETTRTAVAEIEEPSKAAASATAAVVATGAAASLSALRRINAAARTRAYVSAARPCRFAVKIQHAHLSDLPPDLISVLNNNVLAGSGWQAVSAFAREGCVELILDLRPILSARSYTGSSAADDAADLSDDSVAQHDQNPSDRDQTGRADRATAADADAASLDEDTLQALSCSVVSYLHSTGIIQPGREPYVVLQLGERSSIVTWHQESQSWLFAGESGDGSGGHAAVGTGADAVRIVPPRPPAVVVPSPPTAPSLEAVFPRLAVWPGLESPLRLTAAVRGPSAEEILVGGGLVVRHGGRALSYSVVHVQPAGPAAAVAATYVAAAATGAAAAATSSATAQRPLLVVELAVIGVPSSGLLRVEARSSSGQLSAPLTVVVDFDADVVSGLEKLVTGIDRESADAVLQDFGTWMDTAAAVVAAYSDGAVGGKDGGGGAEYGSDDVARPAPASFTCGAAGARPSGALLARIAGPAADVPYIAMPYSAHGLNQPLAVTGGVGGALASSAPPTPPLLQGTMTMIAADLLALCCQSGGSDTASAAVVDRLLAMVAACDGRPPADAVAAVLAAVPTPPTNAGALHLAIAAGSKHVVAVLLHWHERLYGDANGGGGGDLWLSRAACGVTPMHVAAAMSDGGAMAAWAMAHYPAAAAVWSTAASNDGLTPASLAAQLGGRWRLRLWYARPAVLWARRVLALPSRLRAAFELVWGFEDLLRERRYAAARSSQAVRTLTLYAAVNSMLPFLALAKLALGGALTTGSGGAAAAVAAANTAAAAADSAGRASGAADSASKAILAATLVFHVPHAAPLLAWLYARTFSRNSRSGPAPLPAALGLASSVSGTTLASAFGAPNNSHSADHPDRQGDPSAPAGSGSAPRPGSESDAGAWFGSGTGGAWTGRGSSSWWPGCSWGSGAVGSGGGGDGGLRRALLATQLVRAAAKAAAGLSLWPVGVSRGVALCLAHGADIALEAVVRPLVEQLDLSARLAVSLADAPATYLLYRGLERSEPGAVPQPLRRAVLYQVVLLTVTAVVSVAGRARFAANERARAARLEAPLAPRLIPVARPTSRRGGAAAATSGKGTHGSVTMDKTAAAAAIAGAVVSSGSLAAPLAAVTAASPLLTVAAPLRGGDDQCFRTAAAAAGVDGCGGSSGGGGSGPWASAPALVGRIPSTGSSGGGSSCSSSSSGSGSGFSGGLWPCRKAALPSSGGIR